MFLQPFRNLDGCLGTKDDVSTMRQHLTLSSTALTYSPNSSPVQSFMMSFHPFLCLPLSIHPVYEVYRWYMYIVYAFLICLCASVHVNLFFQRFLSNYYRRILKCGTNIRYLKLYCVLENNPSPAHHSLILSIFISLS